MLFDTTFPIDLEHAPYAGTPGAATAFLHGVKRMPKAVGTVTIDEFAVGAPDAGTRRMFALLRPSGTRQSSQAGCRRHNRSRWMKTTSGL